MKLSEACSAVSKKIEVVRDCSFDELYLVGKPYPKGKKTVSFISGADYVNSFLQYDIAGVICTPQVEEELVHKYSGGIVVTDDPKTTFFLIHNHYAEKDSERNPNIIAKTAQIHPTSIIEGHDVKIGENTIISANVVIKSGTSIGNNCIIREGCVLGSPAFYYFGYGDDKSLVKSTGGLVIGNNVELHTSVTIEKGVLSGSTIIGDNTKIDNLTLIGHDSILGDNVSIAAGSTLAGGVVLGNNSFLGVGVTIAPSVKCGSNIKLSAGAVATKDIPDGIHESGNFAIPHDKYLSHIKNISK